MDDCDNSEAISSTACEPTNQATIEDSNAVVGSTVAAEADNKDCDSSSVIPEEQDSANAPTSSVKTADEDHVTTAPTGLIVLDSTEANSTVTENKDNCDSPSVIADDQDATKGGVSSSSDKTNDDNQATLPESMAVDTSENNSGVINKETITQTDCARDDVSSSLTETVNMECKEVVDITIENRENNEPVQSNATQALPIVDLDTTEDSAVVEIGNSSKAENNEPVHSNATQSLPDVINLDTTEDSAVIEIGNSSKADDGLVVDDSVTSLPEMITLDTTSDSTVNDEKVVSCVNGSSKQETLPEFISLDSTEDSSIVTLDSDRLDSSSGLLDEQSSTTKEDTPASPTSMFAIDTTADSVEELQEPSYEAFIPDGMSLDIEGDEEECEVGPASRYDIVPSYESGFAGVLTDIEYNMDTGKKINDAVPKKNCFNCLGDHNVNECPEPHDPQRISANRRKYSTRVPNVRYHEDGDNKYGHFQPGRISEKLRYALGLRPNQLPIYIYRMRVLGYPPGWLRDAEVRQADMKLYDGTGKTVLHPDIEEGETDPVLVKYTPQKLVSFPGFNDPMPSGARDESYHYNCPGMQQHHQRTEFLRFMNMNKAEAYKKRKLKKDSLKSIEAIEAEAEAAGEMEVDESGLNTSAEIQFNPPLPSEPLPPPPPDDIPAPPPPEVDLEEGEISEDSQVSIGDLEEKRRRILKELEDAAALSAEEQSSSQAKKLVNESKKKETEKEVHMETNEKTSDSTNDPQIDAENSQSSDSMESARKKQKQHHRSASMSFKLGAAIPQSCTPFTSLPSADAWQVDVTDHINFENLPDALGTWDKMKGLMKKVRVRVKELQVDEDE